ncbi:MAG: hypothetical protein AB8B69_05240 [Chitinophagales bacterium]
MKTLKQSHFFTTKTVMLDESQLQYKVSKLSKENTVSIPYEDISSKQKTAETLVKHGFLLAAMGLIVFSILLTSLRTFGKGVGESLELYSLALGVISLLIYFVSKEKHWKLQLTNGDFIYFYQSIPDNTSVEVFIKHLMDKRNAYLLKAYGQLDATLDYQSQIDQLQWLKDIKVLSGKNFQQKRKELKRMFEG